MFPSIVVARHFAQESDRLPAVWAFWLAHRARTDTADRSERAGLSAVAPAEPKSQSVPIVLFLDVLLPADLPNNWMPSQADIDAAASHVVVRLGINRAQIHRAVLAVEPALRSALAGRHQSLRASPVMVPDPTHVWVVTWDGQRMSQPERRHVNQLDTMIAQRKCDLVVDEARLRFWSRSSTHGVPFSAVADELRGLWMALRYCGAGFTDKQLRSLPGVSKRRPEGLRKIAHAGNHMIDELIGRTVISRKGRQTTLVNEDWTWVWIRLGQDPYHSRLLNPEVGPDDRA